MCGSTVKCGAREGHRRFHHHPHDQPHRSHHHHHGPEGSCRCHRHAGRVRAFIQPWLLLLLAQQPSHGYDLMARLGEDEELPGAEPGLLYRTLRQMEMEGWVTSTWDTDTPGPARRVYHITEDGVEVLHSWRPRIEQIRSRLSRFVEEYEKQFPSAEKA